MGPPETAPPSSHPTPAIGVGRRSESAPPTPSAPLQSAHGPPIQPPMRGSSTGSRPRQVLSGIGLATALLALLYLAFAVCMAIYAPGHLGRRSLDSLPLPGRRRDRRRPHSHRAWPIARRDRRPLLRVARRGSHGSPLRPMRSATAVRCGAEFLVGSAMTLPSSALAACISSPIASAVRSFIPSSTPA